MHAPSSGITLWLILSTSSTPTNLWSAIVHFLRRYEQNGVVTGFWISSNIFFFPIELQKKSLPDVMLVVLENCCAILGISQYEFTSYSILWPNTGVEWYFEYTRINRSLNLLILTPLWRTNYSDSKQFVKLLEERLSRIPHLILRLYIKRKGSW